MKAVIHVTDRLQRLPSIKSVGHAVERLQRSHSTKAVTCWRRAGNMQNLPKRWLDQIGHPGHGKIPLRDAGSVDRVA